MPVYDEILSKLSGIYYETGDRMKVFVNKLEKISTVNKFKALPVISVTIGGCLCRQIMHQIVTKLAHKTTKVYRL